MSAENSGVFPVYKNAFKVGAAKASLNDIADMEVFQCHLTMVLKTGHQWMQKDGREA